MNISPINFTGTIYFPNQRTGIKTDHITRFQQGSSNRTQVFFSNGDNVQLPVLIEDFVSAYKKARGDEFVEIKTKAKVSI